MVDYLITDGYGIVGRRLAPWTIVHELELSTTMAITSSMFLLLDVVVEVQGVDGVTGVEQRDAVEPARDGGRDHVEWPPAASSPCPDLRHHRS